MKDFIKVFSMIAILVCVYVFKDDISNFVIENIIYKGSSKVLTYNDYYMEQDWQYVQNIDSNEVKSYQEVLNMFYTIINSGDDNYAFNCEYDNCIDDVKKLTDDNVIISEINNFVNPYNSFKSINVDISSSGRINVRLEKLYNEDKINYINDYIDAYIETNINQSMTDTEKIKLFHDYIINNTAYDSENPDSSYTAYDLITTGKSICGGYSDVLAIYLNKLGIKNYRIASDNHIWNLVYINNGWYHVDMTWDDPVASDGKQYLIHNYFMVTTSELLQLDTVEHNFNKDIYLEAK